MCTSPCVQELLAADCLSVDSEETALVAACLWLQASAATLAPAELAAASEQLLGAAVRWQHMMAASIRCYPLLLQAAPWAAHWPQAAAVLADAQLVRQGTSALLSSLPERLPSGIAPPAMRRGERHQSVLLEVEVRPAACCLLPAACCLLPCPPAPVHMTLARALLSQIVPDNIHEALREGSGEVEIGAAACYALGYDWTMLVTLRQPPMSQASSAAAAAGAAAAAAAGAASGAESAAAAGGTELAVSLACTMPDQLYVIPATENAATLGPVVAYKLSVAAAGFRSEEWEVAADYYAAQGSEAVTSWWGEPHLPSAWWPSPHHMCAGRALTRPLGGRRAGRFASWQAHLGQHDLLDEAIWSEASAGTGSGVRLRAELIVEHELCCQLAVDYDRCAGQGGTPGCWNVGPAGHCSDEMEYWAKTSFKSRKEAEDRMPWDPYDSEWDIDGEDDDADDDEEEEDE